MNLNIKILFYPLKVRTNKKGECPLKCRITYQKKRKEFSTGLFINPINWNGKEQRVLNNDVENDRLFFIKSAIESAHLRLKVSRDSFDLMSIYDEYIGKKKKQEKGVSEFYQEYLVKLRKLVGVEIKLSTWYKFKYIGSHIANFIKWKYKKKDILLAELDLNFLTEFDYYLKTEKRHKQITINKTIQRFKKVINISIAEKYLLSNPFLLFKSKSVKYSIVFLDSEELLRLENHYFSQQRLEQIRDCFIFCCYTGLAYLEMSTLEAKHVITGFDDKLWIKMERVKTGKQISIPLLPKAVEILRKYNEAETVFSLPKISNQRFNSYLKEIADVTGIEKNLTHHVARKTFASTVLLFNDVPMEIVSELLGHSSILTTQTHYGKIVQKKLSEHMNILSKELNLRDKSKKGYGKHSRF